MFFYLGFFFVVVVYFSLLGFNNKSEYPIFYFRCMANTVSKNIPVLFIIIIFVWNSGVIFGTCICLKKTKNKELIRTKNNNNKLYLHFAFLLCLLECFFWTLSSGHTQKKNPVCPECWLYRSFAEAPSDIYHHESAGGDEGARPRLTCPAGEQIKVLWKATHCCLQ